MNFVDQVGLDEHAVTFVCGGEPMLRIARTGFYVRGKRLEQDDKEAEQVYNSFTQWLAWQQLNQ
jgi:NAD(P)H-flavin reductase